MAKYSLMPDQQKLVEEHLYLVEIAVKKYILIIKTNYLINQVQIHITIIKAVYYIIYTV